MCMFSVIPINELYEIHTAAAQIVNAPHGYEGTLHCGRSTAPKDAQLLAESERRSARLKQSKDHTHASRSSSKNYKETQILPGTFADTDSLILVANQSHASNPLLSSMVVAAQFTR